MNDSSSTIADAGQEASAPENDPPDSQSDRSEKPGLMRRLAQMLRLRGNGSLRDDLTDALAGDTAYGELFSPEERAMLHNILRLREVRVEDVMVPRADVDAIEVSTSLGELLALFERSGHSRMPVYSDTLDDPRGMIHIRDVVAHITRLARTGKRRARGAKSVAAGKLDLAHVDLEKSVEELSLIRPVLFVPPSMLASDLMARMKAARIQMALVIDEYGGTDGLVSLEDIVEMVVGDIEDEHDESEPMIIQASDGVFVVDARAEIEDIARMIGNGFTAAEHAEDVDTIGGMIFNALGRVPVRGEVVQAVPGYEFHVLDADPRRIKRVRIMTSRVGAARRRAAARPQPRPAAEGE